MDSREFTTKHIHNVRDFLHKVSAEIFKRTLNHDKSKLDSPEKEFFDNLTKELGDIEYGSEEYNQSLQELRPALEHHYAQNSHHPEHYSNGIRGMNLIDLIEMLCDWKASILRNRNGNIEHSIEINQDRFQYTDELKQILLNTLKILKT